MEGKNCGEKCNIGMIAQVIIDRGFCVPILIHVCSKAAIRYVAFKMAANEINRFHIRLFCRCDNGKRYSLYTISSRKVRSLSIAALRRRWMVDRLRWTTLEILRSSRPRKK